MTRNEARKAGLRRYSTGKPCSRDHVAERSAFDGGCVECAKLTQQRWALQNPDKVKAKVRKHKELFAERDKEVMRARYAKKRPELLEYHRQRYLADPNRYRESRSAAGRRWEAKHPERVLAKTRRRAAAKLQRVPKWADHAAINLIYRAAEIAKVTWGEEIHVDHDIPLRGRSVSGLHVHNNLRILLAEANMAKGNRFESR